MQWFSGIFDKVEDKVGDKVGQNGCFGTSSSWLARRVRGTDFNAEVAMVGAEERNENVASPDIGPVSAYSIPSCLRLR